MLFLVIVCFCTLHNVHIHTNKPPRKIVTKSCEIGTFDLEFELSSTGLTSFDFSRCEYTVLMYQTEMAIKKKSKYTVQYIQFSRGKNVKSSIQVNNHFCFIL